MTISPRAFLALLLVVSLAACTPADEGGEDASADDVSRPALVLLISVDQMRADYLDRFGPQLTGGFRALLEDGAVFTNARQDHAITATAPGHNAMLSGLYPRDSGIVDNTWFDRTLGRRRGAVSDPEDTHCPPEDGECRGGNSLSPAFSRHESCRWLVHDETTHAN